MQVVLAILSLGLLALIIYFAFSSKSSRLLKRVAFIALALIALALVIAGIFLLVGPGEDPGHIPIPGFHEPQTHDESRISVELIVFILVFLFIIGLIIYSAYKEQHKKSASFRSAQKRRSTKD
jgi:amino acid transporter